MWKLVLGYQNFQKNNCGCLHSAPDWVCFSDLESTLVIPYTIVILQLRPGIPLYSRTTKTVIIVELTCSCEENMESWHATKFGKYDPLCSAIKIWLVHTFLCCGSRSLRILCFNSCLVRLGLTRKLVRSSLKTLSSAALTASFQI